MRSFALSRTSLERFLTHSHSNNNNKENIATTTTTTTTTTNNPPSTNNSHGHKKRDSTPLVPSLSREARDRKLSSASAPPVTTISTASATPSSSHTPNGGPKKSHTSKTSDIKQSIFAAFLAKMPTASKRNSRHGHDSSASGKPAGNTASATAAPTPLTLETRAIALKDAKAILRTVKNDWEFRPKSARSSGSSKKRKSAAEGEEEAKTAEQQQGEGRTSTESAALSTSSSIPPPSSTPTSPSTAPTTTENTPQKPARENPVTAEPSKNRTLEETIQQIEADIENGGKEKGVDDDPHESDDDHDGDAQWREREESDSDATSPESLLPKQAAGEQRKSGVSVYTDDGVKSPYRFDAPDSVGRKLTAAERREKRAIAQREEMEWNEGLRNWVEQRDAWTRADKKGRIKVAKSMFEDNPLRRLVQPDQYPQIYSRVIIRAAEPPIPINLKDLTASLVQGWKADNQWPPKPQAPEPMFAKRRPNSGSSIGDTMLRKVLGLR